MIRGLVVWTLLWSAAPLAAQLDLFRLEAGQEIPVGGGLDAGSVVAGDFADIRLRLRNLGDETILLENLRAAGTAFTLENHPPLPYTMAPGTNIDFRIRFAPKDFGSYSAAFLYHDRSILVTGRSPELASVLYEQNGQFVLWQNSFTVDFGRVERKDSVVRRFLLSNKTRVQQQVRSAATSSAAYLVEELELPVVLAPGESRPFSVRFAPLRSGVIRADLMIDSRSFTMEGFAVEPPFPEARLVFPETVSSGQQIVVRILFTGPSNAIGVGALTLEGLENDPAVMFLPSGVREASLSVREGDTEVSQVLQTGTTAGDLTLRLTLDTRTYLATIHLPSAPVSVSDIVGVRTTNGIQIRLEGFDNTRSSSEIAFTFYDRSGLVVGGVPVRATVANLFAQYFESSVIGGLFALRAQFPITGNPDEIGAVEIEMKNAAGSAKTSKINF